MSTSLRVSIGLVQIAYDHNYAQNLQLQQIYGGGIGWTFLKTEKQDSRSEGHHTV